MAIMALRKQNVNTISSISWIFFAFFASFFLPKRNYFISNL